MDKTIKVDEETYRKINELVGSLREERGKPVSINEALSELLKKGKTEDIMKFAGSWEMSDAEAKKMKIELKEMWKKWKS